MGTTLPLIFRRFATKFSNLVQKKIRSPRGEGPGDEANFYLDLELQTAQCLHYDSQKLKKAVD